MNILAAALLAMLIGGVYLGAAAWVEQPGLWPMELVILKDAVLWLLSCYLVLAAWKMKQTAAQSKGATAGAAWSLPAREEQIESELVQLLALLQERGRLVDFLMTDASAYSDAQIGAAARVVQQGCAGALRDYFELLPIAAAKEGERLSLPTGYDGSAYRLLGTVTGAGPFQGVLRHRGWQVAKVMLPRLVGNAPAKVVAPAEIEVS